MGKPTDRVIKTLLRIPANAQGPGSVIVETGISQRHWHAFRVYLESVSGNKEAQSSLNWIESTIIY